MLTPSSITETGGVSVVTATLSHPSSEAVTVTVAAAADFTLSTARTLTIRAGHTTSTGLVTVTANGNDVYSPGNMQVRVSGTAAGGNGVADPHGVLTLTDDDTAGISVSPVTRSWPGSERRLVTTESGGTATFTVELDSKPTGNVVLRVRSSDTDEGTVSPSVLTFTPSDWDEAQTVTLTGVDDSPPAADGGQDYTVTLTVNLTGAAALRTRDFFYQGVSALTVYARNRDNEYGLAIGEVSGQATEAGGTATFTVALLTQPTAAVTVAVSSQNSLEGTVDPSSLTFAPSAWSTAQTVTVTGVDDDADDGTVTWAVRLDPSSGDAGYDGLDSEYVLVSTTDDDGPPSVRLSLNPSPVSENGGTATVTAWLSRRSGALTTVTVTPVAGAYTVSRNATIVLSGGETLRSPRESTVTVTGTDNTVDSPDKLVRVTATVTNDLAAADSTTMRVRGSLILTDDDAAPTAALSLDPETVSENGGVSTVTATLSHPSSEPSTVTVTAVAGVFTVAASRIVIAAGATTSTDGVALTAVDNDVDAADRKVTVTATLANGQGAGAVTGASLALTDDDAAPTAALALTPSSITEEGGISTVTATLSHPSSEAVTVAVSAAAGTGAVAADFTLSGTTLTLAAGATTSAGIVTVTANPNDVHSPSKSVTVSGTAAGGRGVADPPDAALTLEDDDALPTVALVLSPSSISETDGISAVAATLSGPSSEAVTVTVAAAAVASTGAVPGDFTLSTARTLTIAAGATTSTGTVTVTAEPNNVDAAKKAVAVSGTAAGGNGVADPSNVTLILTDDDSAGIVVSPSTSATSRLVTTESGGTATFTVELNSEPTGDVVLAVASSDTDEGTAAPPVLTFTPGDWDTAQTVTLTGVDDDMATPPNPVDGSQDYTVTLTVNRTDTQDTAYDGLSALTVYARNRDNESGLAVGAVSGSATEAGGTATFTVALVARPAAAVTVAVSSRDEGEGLVSAGAGAPAASTTLTFAPSAWSTAQTVTVTGVQDPVDDGTVAWSVRLDPSSGDGNYDGLSDVDVSVSTTDDDGPPTVTLALNPASIAESGSGSVSTVTARLSHPSDAATTVTVAPVSGAWTVGAGADATVVIAAGDTTSTDTATVAAVDNPTDEPDRTPTVTATVANDRATTDGTTMAVTGATLTITDDDAAPGVILALNPSSVSENGGIATVTATLSHPSSEPSTVTVPAVAGLYTVGTDATITIAAGATTAASDTVLVTAVDDAVHQGTAGRSATVTAALANGQGAGAVTGAALTLTDDETLPTAALVLTPSSVSETGGVSTVTATLSGPSSEAVTVTVAAAAGAGAVADDFALSTATTLTIAAGSTTSAGTVTVTANGNTVDAPNKSVTVSGTSAGGNGVVNPPNVTLTLEDDETLPTAALVLSSTSISETGGVSTVTATLSGVSSEAVTVTVSAAAGAGAVAADFDLSSATTLTIAAGATVSTGAVTVTANGNTVDAPNKSVTVSGTSAGGNGVVNPPDVTLTLEDDDDLPTVALALSDTSISETGGVSTVTATLSGPSSEAVTVTVSAAAVASTGAVAGDFDLSSATTLTIAAGATTSAGTVTVTANGNAVDAPNKEVTVSGTAAGGNGVADPPAVTLTLEDDDALPTAALVLTPSSITEEGGISTVTATLSGPSSEAVTVTVAAAAGAGAVVDDFALSTATKLTIAAGATTSAGTVTVTANGNAVDSPNKSVTVSGTAAGGHGVADPPDATLTLEDDETLPTVALVLTPSSISETGGVSTVTATLSGPSSAAVTVTVAAAGVASTGAVSGDFTLSTATTLTLAAGATVSAGVVTVAANGNDVDAPNKSVTVSGTAAGGNSVADPPNATLTLTDDDTAGVSVSPATSTTSRLRTTESGGTATFTVRLDSEPTGDVELDVASSDTDEGTAAPAVLTFTSSDWSTAQTVTLTGVDDSPPAADGSQGYTVTLTVDTANTADSNYDALSALTVYAVNADNEYGLDVGSVTGQATEAGGTATFTVALRTQPSEAVTVSVSSRDTGEGLVSAGGGAPAASTTLTFAPAAWSTAQTVTVTGVQDPVDDGTVTWAVRLDPASGDTSYDGLSDEDVSVTTTDDDGPPTVTLALNPSSIAESGTGNVATVTARLSHPSGAATTVTVTAVAGAYTVGSDATIVIAAGETTNASDTATVAAVDNPTDEPDRTPTVTATITNARAAADSTTMTVTGATLTVRDDDAAPTATLALDPSSVSENGGIATVTATLSHPSSEPSTVTVAAVSGAYTVGTDATITIAAGSTTAASDTVLVTAVDDDVHQGSAGRSATVTGALANGQGAGAVTGAALTLSDDETLPTAALALSSTSISETGGVSTVTATLSGPSSEAVTVTVATAPGAGAVVDDFTLSSTTTLTIAAGETTSAGAVTVTANGNTVHSPNKSVTVSGTAAGATGL